MLKEKTSIKDNGIKQQDLETLEADLLGELITPEEEKEYESAREIYNAMIDKHPRFFVRCDNVADVIAGVNFARENDLDLAIHGGGQNGAGLALVDEGLVIDLTPMKSIRVDPETRTVRVEGGCTWGEVDHATHAFGLAVPSGIISTTGVAGLTLGGCHGQDKWSYLQRKMSKSRRKLPMKRSQDALTRGLRGGVLMNSMPLAAAAK
jgi:FAD/FMN-containing dehydrogenase